MSITQNFLHALLTYNPETGDFVWIKRQGRGRAGAKAGSPLGGYTQIRIRRRAYGAHRLAWLYVYGEWPEQVDHVNHDRSDNRLANLRATTNAENHRNMAMRSKNKSGITGVHWSPTAKKWIAQISVGGRSRPLCRSESLFEAACERRRAEIALGFHPNHGRNL